MFIFCVFGWQMSVTYTLLIVRGDSLAVEQSLFSQSEFDMGHCEAPPHHTGHGLYARWCAGSTEGARAIHRLLKSDAPMLAHMWF